MTDFIKTFKIFKNIEQTSGQGLQSNEGNIKPFKGLDRKYVQQFQPIFRQPIKFWSHVTIHCALIPSYWNEGQSKMKVLSTQSSELNLMQFESKWRTQNSEPSQTSKMEPFAKIVNGFTASFLLTASHFVS